jgi:AcrR family transcriptional regulator
MNARNREFPGDFAGKEIKDSEKMGRKSKTDVRRREILEACYRQIEEEGLDGITLKKIGKRMGVAPSLIMHYFLNKDELVESLVGYMLDLMDTVYIKKLEELETAEERLKFYLEENFNLYIAQSVSDKVWYPCLGLGMHNPGIKKGFEKVFDRDLEISTRLIEDFCMEKGIPCVHPRQEAVKLVSFVEGLNNLHAVYGSREVFKQAIYEYKNDFIAHLLMMNHGKGEAGEEKD